MENDVTIVSFHAKVTKEVIIQKDGTRDFKHILKHFTCCYIGKTDIEIHEQLNGWDIDYKLSSVIRLTQPVKFNSQKEMFENKITAVFFNVMDKPNTEVFFDKSLQEIRQELTSRNYESHVIKNFITADAFTFDAINSITKFKDTN